MANRYWVDTTGTGVWDGTAGSKWSTTPGGAGGAAVPTASDDVFFDGSSGNCSVSGARVCLNLNFTGYTNTFSGSGGLTVSGNLTWVAGMTRTYTGTITFNATSGTKIITSNGIAFGGGITFNGSGGTFQLADNLSIAGTLTRTNGTFDPNGKAVTQTSGNVVGTFTFYDYTRTGAASKTDIVTFSANITVSHNLALNGNSTTNRLLIASDTYGTARTITAANVSVSNADFRDITGAGAGSWNLSGITGNSGDCLGNSGITFTTGATQYWSSNTGSWDDPTKWFLATAGGGGAGRVPLPQDNVVFDGSSFSLGSRTVTVNMPRSGKDITMTGVTNTPLFSFGNQVMAVYGSVILATITATGANGSISFEARSAVNLTSVVSLGIGISCYVFGSTLSLLDNLTTTNTNVGIDHRYGTFDATTKNVTSGIYNGSAQLAHTLNMGTGIWTITGTGNAWLAAANTWMTLNPSTSTLRFSGASQNISTGALTYGAIELTNATPNATFTSDLIAASLVITGSGAVNMSFSAWNVTTLTANTSTVTFSSGAGVNLTPNGQSFYNLIINKTAGVAVTLQGALTVSNLLTLTQGTLTANNQNVTAAQFASSNSNTRVLTMGNGNWTLTGTGTVWDISTATNLTITPGNSVIIINDASATGKTFAGNTKTYAAITFSGDNITVSGDNTFTTFAVNNAGLTNGLKLTAGSTQTVSAFTTNGSVGNLAKLLSTSGGSAANLSKPSGTVSVDYMSIQDSAAAGGAAWYAGANSTDVSGNTGWIFTAPPTPNLFDALLLAGN